MAVYCHVFKYVYNGNELTALQNAMWKENLERYDYLVAKCDLFERKGKTMPYTSANGSMFSLLNKEGQFGVRFSKEVQVAYFKMYSTTYFHSYNAVMKGYVLIPEHIFCDDQKMIALLNESFEYVMSLPPK